jgi:hypothetical protein
MNSIQDLNLFANLVEFSDPRVTNVLFNRGTAENGTQTTLEGQAVEAYYGIDIVEIRNYQSVNLSYTVNISNLVGGTLTFDSLPEHMTLDNPDTGIYVVTGFQSVFDWERVRSPSINLPVDYSGTTTYSSELRYLNNQTKAWTTTLNVTDVIEWNTASPADYWFTTGSNVVTAPLLIDEDTATESWFVTIIPSNASLFSSIQTFGVGGSTEYNTETKTLRINGTNAEINSHLSTLRLIVDTEVQEHFTLSYRASNINSGQSDTVTQNIKSIAIRYFTAISPQLYNEDQNFTVTSPVISHPEAAGAEIYTILVTPSVAAAVDSISSSGSGGSVAFNTSTKVLTIIGSKTQVNSHLSTLLINAGKDYSLSYVLIYSFSVSTGASQNRQKNIVINNTHDEASNLNLAREFQSNTTNSIFASNPIQITDTDTEVVAYTVTLSLPGTGNPGVLNAPGTTSSASIVKVGTKSEVNTWLSQVTYTPSANYFLNVSLFYSQSKDGFTQLNAVPIQLNGPKVAFSTLPPNNQNIAVIEGSNHSVPVGTNIIGINDPLVNLPTYTINVSAVPGATVTWPVVPSGSVVTQVSSGVFRINNITSVARWNDVRSPTVRLPNNYDGTFAYTATVAWLNGQGTVSWTVTTAVSNVDLLTAPQTFEYNSLLNSTIAGAKVLNGTPDLVDVGNQTLNYTVTITPSQPLAVTTISNTFAQGFFNFNTSTKVATIQGTLSQVNGILDSLRVRSNNPYDIDYTLNYYATNTSLTEVDLKLQPVVSTNNTYLGAVRSHDTYSANTAKIITGGPLPVYTGPENQTLNVYPVPSSAVSLLDININELPYDNSNVLPVEPDAISKNGDTFIQGLNIYRRVDNKTWTLHHTLTVPADFNPSTFDYFDGYSETAHATQPSANVAVTISDDGNNIAIGHRNQITTGNVYEQGAVWIWARSGTTWISQGKVIMPTWSEITGTTTGFLAENPYFGTNLTFSNDGSTLAVGAPLSVSSNSFLTGTVGGIVAVYVRSGGTWSRQRIIKDPNAPSNNEYGYFGGNLDRQNNAGYSGCLVLSTDGNTLIVGRGAAKSFTVFTRSGSTWTTRGSYQGGPYQTTGLILAASGDCRVIGISGRFDSTSTGTAQILTANSTYTSFSLWNTTAGNHGIRFVSIDGSKVVMSSSSGTSYFIKAYTSANNFYATETVLITNVGSFPGTPFVIDDATQTIIRGLQINLKFAKPVWDPVTKTLTIVSDRPGIVTLIDLIQMTPNSNAGNFELWYDLTRHDGIRSVKNQRITLS